MKWENRGREFDEIGKNFVGKDIIIFAAGDEGRKFYEKTKFLNAVTAFVDKDKEKQKSGWCGVPVLSFEEFAKLDRNKYIVVIALKDLFNYRAQAFVMMTNLGYDAGRTLFYQDIFLHYYLPIYALYAKDILYFPSICLVTTTQCNLNCRCCLNFTSYNKDKRHIPIERLKENIDLLMKNVDYLDFFHITGGESFLYPKLLEFIEYIGEKWRNKINDLCVVTNGTILPTEKMCKVFKEYSVHIQLDDYRRTIKERSKIEEISEIFDKEQVNYDILQVPAWINMNPNENFGIGLSDEDLKNRFTTCNSPLSCVSEGRLFNCVYNSFAATASLISKDSVEDDYLDLRQNPSKKELLEYRMGFNKRGYVEYCKRCPGHEWANVHDVLPGEQIK